MAEYIAIAKLTGGDFHVARADRTYVRSLSSHLPVTGRFLPKIEERVKETLESLIGREDRLVFLCGGMGQFGALCRRRSLAEEKASGEGYPALLSYPVFLR